MSSTDTKPEKEPCKEHDWYPGWEHGTITYWYCGDCDEYKEEDE